MKPDVVLEVRQLGKTFSAPHGDLTVLAGIDFEVAAGATCAIVGPSGSGKTTLLGLCAGLDAATSGSIQIDGARLDALDEEGRAALRLASVGFVFQDFQLLPTLTALENVMVPLELRGDRTAQQVAAALLADVGLADRADHYPIQLSGGEQQRVALARAFVTRPKVLFADEPTGNLDAETSDRIETLLFELNRAHGTALVVVTHDESLAARAQQVIRLRGGRMVAAAGTPNESVGR